MGLNLSELPEIIGISKAMLFAYRSGKNRITSKVWRKLESAERLAGLSDTSDKSDPSDGGSAKSAGKPKDFPGAEGENLPGRVAALEAELARQREELAVLYEIMAARVRGDGKHEA